jgi:MFS family permease
LYASSLIARYDWRAVFYLGAAATAVLLPIAFFLIPESVHWLTRQQPLDALAKVNRSLKQLGHSTILALPKLQAGETRKSLADIFSPALAGITLIVTSAYFLHILTFYFLLKWTPKIVVDMGFNATAGGRVLTMANFGGAAGGAIFGLLTARIGLKPLSICVLTLNAVAVAIFGRAPADLDRLTLLAVVVGFFGNAAVSGLYSIVAYVFPTHVRATGTGFVIGIGRAGAVLSPWLVGYLLESGATLPKVGIIMGAGSLLAAGAIMFLQLKESKTLQVDPDIVKV